MFNSSAETSNTENFTYASQVFCVVPEYLNLFFLSSGLYGMYQGIEISHPLYAVLFLNLTVSLISTMLDIAVFFFISTARYIFFSNLMNNLSVFFHCTSWCMTSVLRFIYIIYGDWLNNFIPYQKLQCTLSVIMTFVLTTILSIPTFSIIISYGK